MSEYSVKNISKLPMLLPEKNGGLARSFMLKVLAKLQVGSLTLKEQNETLTFGSLADPSAPHAEIIYRRTLIFTMITSVILNIRIFKMI